MKKLLSLFLVLVLCIGTGCSSGDSEKETSQDDTKVNDEDNSSKESKEVDLSDYPKVYKAISAFMDDFSKINSATEKPVSLVQNKAELNESYETLSIEYICPELKVTVEIDLNGTLMYFDLTSQTGEKDEAYLSAVTSAIMLNNFEFSEKDRSNIAQMVANDEVIYETEKHLVSNVSTGSLLTFIISKK